MLNSIKAIALAVAASAILASAPAVCAQPAPASDRPGQPASVGGSSPDAAYGARADGGRGSGRAMTLADYQSRFRDRILQADTDHDGRVSLAEWSAYQAQRSSGGQEGEGRRHGGGFGDPTRQFQMMDVNRDGYVTAAEIDTASAERFARMDANHDGVLTPDERRAMRGGRGGSAEGQPGQQPPPSQ